jgi:hypothetical protein
VFLVLEKSNSLAGPLPVATGSLEKKEIEKVLAYTASLAAHRLESLVVLRHSIILDDCTKFAYALLPACGESASILV